jgi:ABC-type transport system substrate-binding protein
VKKTQLAALGAAVLFAGLSVAGAAQAQKQGGTLRVWHRDSPGNMSILEEGTISIVAPIMGVFNNLVMFDPNVKQNSLRSIVPDLAESWSWSEDGTELTFKLRSGVKWHDGNPFTAADVKCTFDLVQGKSKQKLRVNAREAWWLNLKEVTTEGDAQATFHMKRPQPAFIELLASGFTPIYPCHVSPGEMRAHPIGRGDFTFAQSLVGSGLDDPDQNFYENYICDSNRNYTKYCNRELDKLIDQQSMEPDQEKRKQLVWQIDSKLQEDVVRPILYHMRQGTCWRPEVKGINLQVNSIYNRWRMEDVWLDR